jgi:hypothetical protein
MSTEEGGTEVRSYIVIGYTSETPQDYSAGLSKCKTLGQLREHVQTYRRVADDAWQIVKDMEQPAFLELLSGLRKERKGEFAGEEWAEKYMNIMLPEILFRVGAVAVQYGTPWGCAYIRLRDVGRIVERNRIARWVDPTASSVTRTKAL